MITEWTVNYSKPSDGMKLGASGHLYLYGPFVGTVWPQAEIVLFSLGFIFSSNWAWTWLHSSLFVKGRGACEDGHFTVKWWKNCVDGNRVRKNCLTTSQAGIFFHLGSCRGHILRLNSIALPLFGKGEGVEDGSFFCKLKNPETCVNGNRVSLGVCLRC